MKFKWSGNKKFFFNKIFSAFRKGDIQSASLKEHNTNTNIDNTDYASSNSNPAQETKNPLESIEDKSNQLNEINNSELSVPKNQLENLKQVTIKKKYEIYSEYKPSELLKVDKEFGDVVKYSEFLDEGKEKFATVLTKYMEENRHLEKNAEYKSLMKIVDEKSKLFYSNYKEEYKYTLKPYEERWYKEAIYSKKSSDFDVHFRREDPMKKRAQPLENKREKARKLEQSAYEPDHPTYPTAVRTPFESYTDLFQWLTNLDSEETKKFIEFELLYSQHCLFKYSTLEHTLLEDINDNLNASNVCPVQLSKNHIVFKKDQTDISLYSVDAQAIPPEHRGAINIHELNNSEVKVNEIFGLKDFIELNTRFTDLTFLDFAKRLLDGIESENAMLVDFAICPREQFLILFFDMTGEMKTFDILIKDMKNDVLLPIVILNTDASVAFDKWDGIFYTQMDITGRPCKVFRHQIGKARTADVQLYSERSKDFKVRTYNCNSKEMVYIEIVSTAEGGVPVNEVWFKPASDLDKLDFSLIKKMEKNVSYSAKYYNGAFYILTNKTDTYDKTLQSFRVSDAKVSGLLEHSKTKETDANTLITSTTLTNVNQSLQTNSDSNSYKGLISFDSKAESSLIPIKTDLVHIDEHINIIDFEIFKNFLVVLEEENQKRRFKIFNLLTNSKYFHEPEGNLTDIRLSDNLSFDAQYFRYIHSSPVSPHQTVDFSLGTRKVYPIHSNEFSKYDSAKYKMEVVHIPDRAKEISIPVVLAYKEEQFNSNSPFVIYTKGAGMNKKDLEFNEMAQGLLDKGFVLAIPQIRGSKCFDFEWYQAGVAENKLKHFTDFMDVAFYFKETGMAEKLILLGEGPSGGMNAAVSFMQYPDFFDSVVLHNPATDIFDYCQTHSYSVDVVEEFGDIRVRQFYEMMKLYSPYHTVSPYTHCPILITCDNRNLLHHSLKLTAKLRRRNKGEKQGTGIKISESKSPYNKDKMQNPPGRNKIFFELLSNRISEEEKWTFIYSFIIGNTYIN